MANTRLNSVWAENAVTNIPDVPVTGVAYRDETYNDNYEEGQQYDAIYNSAKYNQFFYQVSSLLKELCEQGLLQFVEGQHYVSRAVCFYDNNVYIALREIPADEVPYPVPGSSTAWLKLVWQAGKGLTTDYTGGTINFNAGAGLVLDEENNVNVQVGPGMTIQNDTIMPLVGQGIGLDENGKIQPMLGKGLEFGEDGSINVLFTAGVGAGLYVDSDGKSAVGIGAGVKIDASNKIAVNTGQGLSTDTAGALNVLYGQGFALNSSNQLYANLGNGVEFSSNKIQVKRTNNAANAVIVDGNGVYVDTFPIGSILAFAGNGTPNGRGWLFCNGANISRTTYASLFSVIGTIFGAGDGSTTFTLPNANGRCIGGTTGNQAYVSAGLPNITGWLQTNHSLALFGKGQVGGAIHADTNYGGSVAGTTGSYSKGILFNASWSNSLYGKSSTVQPDAWNTRWYIKASY